MRALLLDSGNTRIKAAIAVDGRIVELHIFERVEQEAILHLAIASEVEACCVCDVSGQIDAFIAQLEQRYMNQFHCVSATSRVPFNTDDGLYPTMGSDRIAALVGAYLRTKPRAVLVIDAGTALTYDFLDSNATYCGGLISLGVEMRLRALHTFTGRLPLVRVPKERVWPFTSEGTEQSLQAGLVAGVVGEAFYLVEELKKRYPEFVILLTGGDAGCLSNFYFCESFVVQNLVLEGLYELLVCNV